MGDPIADQRAWRARVAVWLQTIVVLNVASVCLIERAELFRVYRGGVMIGYMPGRQTALLVAYVEALGVLYRAVHVVDFLATSAIYN